MTEQEAEEEIARLRAVIERNRAAFVELRASAIRWRDRAIAAEAALAEARRGGPRDAAEVSAEEMLMNAIRGRKR